MAARAGLLDRIAAARTEENRFGVDTWITDYLFAANAYGGFSTIPGVTQTLAGMQIQEIAGTLPGHLAALRRCPPAFAAQMVRAMVLSQARFTFRNLPSSPTPRRLFGTNALSVLETPWTNATTGELLARMEWHEGLAGNAYVARRPGRLRVLRPDWVGLVYGSDLEPDDPAHALDGDLLGYVYCNGGFNSGNKPQTLLPNEVAHWSPLPDPENAGIGMSWITPAVREILGDQAATEHKLKFFTNGATPNMVVKGLPANREQFLSAVNLLDATHTGLENAYRTLYMTAGADVTVVGKDLQQIDFRAVQGAGEPLALDTPVPTPAGWTTMGNLAVGDQVIGTDGRAADVLAVSPVHLGRPCYRLVLQDRTEIVADAGHLWSAVDRGTASRPERVYTTQELYDLHRKPYANGAGGHRLALRRSPVMELPAGDLLIDPYVLGVWLGDGETAGAAVCGDAKDLPFIADEVRERGYTVVQRHTAADRVDVIGLPGGLLAALRAEGVLGDKHIPAVYLRASAAQRLDLLRGLMDTDGHVETRKDVRTGKCEYSTKLERLGRQVTELVRSLGYTATLSWKADVRSRTGGTWRVYFRAEPDRVPFLLPRKAACCVVPGRVTNRSIVTIEPVSSVPVRCITVDTDDHLFLAGEGFTPTHNTRITMLSRVHPVILAAAEGLQGSALNAGNFGMARRIWADTWIFPMLQDLSASLQTIVDVPPNPKTGLRDSELWADTTDMPILREDAKDAADIQRIQAETINGLVKEGFTPDSAIAAVMGQNMTLLKHTGLVSVQLQPPGTVAPSGNGKAPALPAAS